MTEEETMIEDRIIIEDVWLRMRVCVTEESNIIEDGMTEDEIEDEGVIGMWCRGSSGG